MKYSQKVIDLYTNPKNVGGFDNEKNDCNIGTAIVGSPACGDVIKLQIKVDENGVITDAKFKTFGCGAAIASSSLITEMLKGKNLTDAKNIKNTQVSAHLSLPPVKIHCSVLAEEAISGAIDDYLQKTGLKKDK